MKVNVDSKRLEQLLQKNVNVANDIIDDAYTYFVSITPKDTGNARRNTHLDRSRKEIRADYAYAYRLDTGWSKQAKAGMSKPTLAKLDQWLQKALRTKNG